MTSILTWFLGLVSRTWIPSTQLTCEEQVVSCCERLKSALAVSQVTGRCYILEVHPEEVKAWMLGAWSRNFCLSLWCLWSQLKLFLGSLGTMLMVINTNTFSGYRGSVFQGVAFWLSQSQHLGIGTLGLPGQWGKVWTSSTFCAMLTAAGLAFQGFHISRLCSTRFPWG